MSPDLRGPPAGPRRPGTMIFKCVESLVQLKNNNSSYWLLHITSALNCKIWLIFLASILCHVRNMIKKYMGKNVTKIYISAINENRFFATFTHIVIKKLCMVDLFEIPLCGKNFDTCIFYYISWEIKCYIDRQAGLRGPDPWSCCPTFYNLAPFFAHFAIRFNHYSDR